MLLVCIFNLHSVWYLDVRTVFDIYCNCGVLFSMVDLLLIIIKDEGQYEFLGLWALIDDAWLSLTILTSCSSKYANQHGIRLLFRISIIFDFKCFLQLFIITQILFVSTTKIHWMLIVHCFYCWLRSDFHNIIIHWFKSNQ